MKEKLCKKTNSEAMRAWREGPRLVSFREVGPGGRGRNHLLFYLLL